MITTVHTIDEKELALNTELVTFSVKNSDGTYHVLLKPGDYIDIKENVFELSDTNMTKKQLHIKDGTLIDVNTDQIVFCHQENDEYVCRLAGGDNIVFTEDPFAE